MRRKITITTADKTISIDEPSSIKIMLKDDNIRPFYLRFGINNKDMGKLRSLLRQRVRW